MGKLSLIDNFPLYPSPFRQIITLWSSSETLQLSKEPIVVLFLSYRDQQR